MFRSIRSNSDEDALRFQSGFARMFDEVWTDFHSAKPSGPSLQVHAFDNAWRLEIALAGIDPRDVNVEVAGNVVTIRAQRHSEYENDQPIRYQQSFRVPQFLDINRITASHRHGLLVLTVPLKESVKPRRVDVEIEAVSSDQKKLTAA